MAYVCRRHCLSKAPLASRVLLPRPASFCKFSKTPTPDDGEIDLITLRRRVRGTPDPDPDPVAAALREHDDLPRPTSTPSALASTKVDQAILEAEKEADKWFQALAGMETKTDPLREKKNFEEFAHIQELVSKQDEDKGETDVPVENQARETEGTVPAAGEYTSAPVVEKFVPTPAAEKPVMETEARRSVEEEYTSTPAVEKSIPTPAADKETKAPRSAAEEYTSTPAVEQSTGKSASPESEYIPVYYRDEYPHQMNPTKTEQLEERDRPLTSMDEPLNYGRSSVYPEPDLEHPYPASKFSYPSTRTTPLTSSSQKSGSEPEWTGLHSSYTEDHRNPTPAPTPQSYLLLSNTAGSPHATLLRSSYPPPLQNVVPQAALLPYFDLLHKHGLQLIGGNRDVLVWSGPHLSHDLVDEINKPPPGDSRILTAGEEMARREWRRRQRRLRTPRYEQPEEEKRVGWVRGFLYTGLWVGGLSGVLAALGSGF